MAHTEVFGKLKGEKEAFSFGSTAEIDTDVVKELRMGPALRRFGKQLAKQMGVPGIRFLRIEFHSVLDMIPVKKPQTKSKRRKS